MSYSSRFWLYAPLCLFLALAAWAGLHWWNVASALNKKLDAMKGREAVPGIVIDWRTKTLSGFPFNLDLVFTGLSVKGAGAHGPFAWSAEKFAMHALTYGVAKQVMEAAGQQHLAWTGEDGKRHVISFLPAELHASAISTARGLVRFDLDILDAGGKDTDGKSFAAGRLQLHLRRDPKEDGLDLMASADAVKTGDGRTIRSTQAYSELTHGAAFAALLRGEASWPRAHADWIRQGGVAKQVRQQSAEARAVQALLSPLY
jgi:hypothetical protein